MMVDCDLVSHNGSYANCLFIYSTDHKPVCCGIQNKRSFLVNVGANR